MSSKVAREKGYVGETRTQLRHGYGIYKYSNQFFRYEGEWKEGKKHGHGKLVMADGSFYEGEFINGEIEGHGFRKWASSGNTYSGQFCNGELNGFGVMTYGTGAVYEGEFQDNRKEGRGVMKYPDGSIYEGFFHLNVRHGEGSQTFGNGDVYIGDWVQDKRQGSGELRFHDGSIYDGQWRNDCYNGEGTFIHSSGMTYDGMWINGRPAVEAARIVLVTPEYQEITQDAPFTVAVEIRSEEDELVTDEQGRELHVSAGFQHLEPNQGSPLLDLIEDMEETPISTPYYDVINYPITEYSYMKERLKILGDDFCLMVPPSTGYSEVENSPNASAAPSVREESPSRLDESAAILETEKADPQQERGPSPQEAVFKPPEDGGEQVALETAAEVVKETVEHTQESGHEDGEGSVEVKGEVEEGALNESPVPPSVSSKRSQSGKLQFEDISLPPPPPGYRPFSVLDINLEEEAKAKVRNSKTGALAQQLKIGAKMGKNIDELPFQPPEQVNFDKIKDPKVAKAKRERLYGDERFARPGEYIIIVSDVTEPPFLGRRLPPAYCRLKILHPKKAKKVKTATKRQTGAKPAD